MMCGGLFSASNKQHVRLTDAGKSSTPPKQTDIFAE